MGSHIAFGAGQYEPATAVGKRLLAHELTHVVQQGHAPAASPFAAHTMLQRQPRTGKKGGGPQKTSAVDLDTARKVMWLIIKIINIQDRTDPEKWTEKAEWFLKYKDLLVRWYSITHGEKTNGSRTRLKGDVMQQRIDEAMAATQPILDVLGSKGGKQWKKDLRLFFYPKVTEFEFKAQEERLQATTPAQPGHISYQRTQNP